MGDWRMRTMAVGRAWSEGASEDEEITRRKRS
jgi:hypothetical protein